MASPKKPTGTVPLYRDTFVPCNDGPLTSRAPGPQAPRSNDTEEKLANLTKLAEQKNFAKKIQKNSEKL